MSSQYLTLYKMIVLYMLKRCDVPLSKSQIYDFILEKEYTTFLTLQEVFSELVISELVKKEGLADKAFFVGYRSCEWVGDTFCSFRWINQDGSYQEVMPSMYDFWDYHSPGYDYTKNEWSFEAGEQEVGLAKYFDETGMIYIFDAPDRVLSVSLEYSGELGFICEYD